MYIYKALGLVLANLALSQAAACPTGGCGTADACVLTEKCTTATFVSPSTTTITTCVPTATCAGHPASSATRTNNAARVTVLLVNVDRRMINGQVVVRIMGLALSMSTAAMGIPA
ncbi:hypothetical protein N7455_010276 [Penicillium solitum]|uniref:Extracellular membrane protein CFEM domain-containing protein n=1 Tax=Penicillium solitum TaxID=60172 RepID=A0A1V6RB52_9EURO|nr:uncharacterized protein PENSOL_c008G06430 [Penicillium solitum]KAF4764389.1 hypothetical protein HAV15_001046 [Penicillium sp. str. \